MKFAIFLKSRLLFNSFYCVLCLYTKLYGSITYKLEQLRMRKFPCLESESVSRSFRQKEDNFKISFIHLLYIHSYIQTKFFKKIISECSSDKLINSKKICIGFLHSSEKLVSLNEKILYWSEKLKPLNSKTFKAL